ncbi:MAG TPA: hypothetical protein VGO49_09545 [Bradyrhizobium sp.]|jgi:hypothetical protein|nr:hypothetical protein [Bradyrhizobium sp.]
MFKDANGTDDSFAGTADPPPHPVGIPGLSVATNIYDQTASNYHFGDTFTLNKPGQITRIRVTTRLKANSGDATNDGISFSTVPTFTPGYITFSLPWATGTRKFWFDLIPGSQLGMVSSPPGGAGLPPNVPGTFFDNSPQRLHVYVQDDTSVDYIQIEGCFKPAPKYDLVASKKHDGSAYFLNVHNAGSQIMPTGHVDVVEVVPAGLTITTFPLGPWSCTGSLPVVGPDSFTCSYQIPGGGIAAGANLPPIVLKSDGTAECPNCMRVKLYLKEFEGGVKPVDEADMKNNVSCVK